MVFEEMILQAMSNRHDSTINKVHVAGSNQCIMNKNDRGRVTQES
jgi:hypothetical protein